MNIMIKLRQMLNEINQESGMLKTNQLLDTMIITDDILDTILHNEKNWITFHQKLFDKIIFLQYYTFQTDAVGNGTILVLFISFYL